MVISPSTLVWITIAFAAICLWQMLAGLSKMRRARAEPGHPHAPLWVKMGRIQAIAGGAMLAGNILLNLPMLRALLSSS